MNTERDGHQLITAPDVFDTTGTAVIDPTTDGTIATRLYKSEKLKAVVDLLVKLEKEEKKK